MPMPDERVTRLVARRGEALSHRKAIVTTAESESRDQLTEDEDRRFHQLTDEIKSYDERIDELSAEAERGQNLTAGARAVARAQGGHANRSALPLPADFGRDELRAMHNALLAQQPYRMQARSLTGGGDPLVTAERLVGAAYIDMPRVASLFGTQGTDGATVRVYAATTAAGAGVTAEGAAKTAAGMVLAPVDVEMQKITSWERISYELMLDFTQFVAQISRELTRAVIARENATLTSTITGSTDTTSQTSAGDVGLDSTAEAIATLQASGIEPDAIVMSPGRLAAIRKATATGTGDYFVSPLAGGPTILHGLEVTITPELADTTLLVGAFREAGTVYVREQVSVRTGLDGSDFSENMISLVAEERLALALTQPARIVDVDVTTA